MPNIFLTRQIPEIGMKMLRDAFGNFDMHTEDRIITHEELLKAVEGRDGVLCLLTDPVDEAVFRAAGPQCKIFSNYGVGYNNIDVAAASKLGIMITNTPGVLTDATADCAIALLFAAARHIAAGDKFTRAGKFNGWGHMHFLGQDITGKTLGIIGCGRIGSTVARKMAKGFGMKVLYFDNNQNHELEQETHAEKVTLEELLKESDFVSLHVDLNPTTHHLIDEKALGLMKKSAILINTARGPVVDEKALVKTLKEKKIYAAGLDVFEQEPALSPGLIELENVIILPHLASATYAARDAMAKMAAQNLIDGLEGRMPKYCVNPSFALPVKPIP